MKGNSCPGFDPDMLRLLCICNMRWATLTATSVRTPLVFTIRPCYTKRRPICAGWMRGFFKYPYAYPGWLSRVREICHLTKQSIRPQLLFVEWIVSQHDGKMTRDIRAVGERPTQLNLRWCGPVRRYGSALLDSLLCFFHALSHFFTTLLRSSFHNPHSYHSQRFQRRSLKGTLIMAPEPCRCNGESCPESHTGGQINEQYLRSQQLRPEKADVRSKPSSVYSRLPCNLL